MFKFLKKHKKIALFGSLVTFSLTSAIVASVAWFQVEGKDTITDIKINSGVVANYFEGKKISENETHFGNGTENDPFIIARPEQLFNLMELMKSEDAKMTSDSSFFYLNSYYFQFGIDYGDGPKFYDYTDEGTLANNSATPTSKVLNMKYYSDRGMLTPIGSPAHPFIGHINGCNLTVDNITIDGTDCSDVGIFGYIASPATVKNLYFDNLTIDVGISSLSGQNTGDHSSHKHDSNAAVGYIVGHVYDADAALSNVYVNKCAIVNQSAGNKATSNNFGYIGKSDTNEIISDEASQNSVELKASSLHSYLSNNYDNIKGYGFSASNGSSAQSVTRDAGYSGSGNDVDDMITKSSDTYTFTNSSTNSKGNTSLATAGYTSDDTILRDVNYEIVSGNTSNFEQLSPSTQILSSVPDINPTTSTLSDGYYLYYDSSLESNDDYSNWQYVEVKTSSGVVTTVQLNCFYMTFTINSTKYYVTYNNGNLVPTTTTPQSAAANQRENYYFCLRESAGSYGISSYSTANAQTDFHIYSIGAKKYLHASISGVSSSFSFVENFSSALEFSQLHGNSDAIVAKTNENYKFLCTSSSITLKRFVSTDVVGGICFEGIEEPDEQPSYANDYEKVTSSSTALSANDVITFVYNDNDTYYAIADQAKNNRLTTEVTMSQNNTKIEGANATKLSSFLLEGNSSAWEFKDTHSNQYLYAAGQKSSGQNYLKSQDTNNSKGQWTISLDSSGNATIHSNGNSYVPYLDYVTGRNNDGTYHIFRAFRTASCKPMIFRKAQISDATTYIYSSFQFAVETTSTSQPEINTYNLRYNWVVGAPIVKEDLFLDDENAVFILSNSTVRLKPTGVTGTLQLVTSSSQLTAGSKYTFATDYSYDDGAYYTFSSKIFNAGKYIQSTIYSDATNYSYVEEGIAFCYDDIMLMDLGGDATNGWTFYTNDSQDRNRNTYTASDGYLTSDDTSTAQITKSASIEELSRFDISIDSGSGHKATIISKNSNVDSKYIRYFSGTYKAFEMSTIDDASSYDIYLYKYIPLGETSYIGDQIGDNYDPNYIDVAGSFDSTSTAMTFASSSAVAAPSTTSKFHAPSLGSSAVVFAEYNGSMDLGRIDIEYTESASNSLKVNKNGENNTGVLKSVEGDLGINNDGDSTNRLNTLYITTSNINKFALCALDETGAVVATFDGSDNVNGSTANAKYYVINLRANGGSVSIKRIAYSFTQLPGNNGNFGHVGYRSADYSSSTWDSTEKVWTQSAPLHATDATILNYYFNTSGGVYSYIYVSFDYENMRYNITAYCTQSSELYLFNYDPTVYTVYVNGARVIAGSNIVHINATAYDFETGWAT